MGYCIKLISKKEIKDEDIKTIMFNLPEYFKSPIAQSREQEWGWPCVCDVHKPKGNELMISGSFAISGNNAQDFVAYIQHALDDMGYDTDIGYTDSILLDEEISKDVEKSKLKPEIHFEPTCEELSEQFIDFNEKTTTTAAKAAEAISNVGKQLNEYMNKNNCTHCGIDMSDHISKYCEECYQDLVVINTNLEIEIKKRIPEEDVIFFMSKLRDIIIKPQTNNYKANDKLKDISELYLKHIGKLGGIKYESND